MRTTPINVPERTVLHDAERVTFSQTLRSHGQRTALVDPDGGELTYTDLANRVEATAERLGTARRLVLVEAENSVDCVVAYLSCLSSGHPVLMAPAAASGRAAPVMRTFDPDVRIGRDDGRWTVTERRVGTNHALHPDLAALLSTSGSTGSVKLVRLSAANLSSNAAAIASYLDLDADERALTSLPLAYCYGLSVLNSHLQVGASVVLNDASVVDRCFWDRLDRHGATSFATVPHSFELLDRVGFARDGVPASLRTVTQAGGRLAPEVVARYSATARRQGWRLVVMYGQTEATARMAYLPPDLAESHPRSIGRPIPGGSFRIEPAPGAPEGEGELVYRGPNVMLGYATGPGELALGRVVEELRTGDLGRRTADGLYEVTGRAARFVKLFGLRIALDEVEQLVTADGHAALCAGSDAGIRIAVVAPADPERIRQTIAERLGLPEGSVSVALVDALPRLESGKPDYATVSRLEPADVAPERSPMPLDDPIGTLFATALRADHVEDRDTFVSLGGDSLSYVEVSYELERLIGHLPPNWHQRSIGELRTSVPVSTPARSSSLDTTVLIKALAIVAVVAGHARLTTYVGGGHLLLGVAGYNAARFMTQSLHRPGRVRRGMRQIGRFALPAAGYLAVVALVVPGVHVTSVALFSAYAQWGSWRFRLWFVEALAQITLLLVLAFCIPAVRRAERRAPFLLALGVTGLGLALRELDHGDEGYEMLQAHAVLWIFALGWAAQRADTAVKRAAATTLAIIAMLGWYDGGVREIVATVGVILITWAPAVPWPSRLRRPVVTVAAASLAIYLVQWSVLDHLSERVPAQVVVVAAVGGGIVAWKAAEALRSVRPGTGWFRVRVRGHRRLDRAAASTPAT